MRSLRFGGRRFKVVESQISVIAGAARGLSLSMPGDDAVRPTIGRAREALFASLGSLEGCRFWDLFAGSGANGCEAASRGAGEVIFVERDAGHCRVIEENLRRVAACGARGVCQVVRSGCEEFVSGRHPAPGVIFADPPYEESAEFFGRIAPLLVRDYPGAVVIWEVPGRLGAAGEFLEAGASEMGFRLENRGGTGFLVRKNAG